MPGSCPASHPPSCGCCVTSTCDWRMSMAGRYEVGPACHVSISKRVFHTGFRSLSFLWEGMLVLLGLVLPAAEYRKRRQEGPSPVFFGGCSSPIANSSHVMHQLIDNIVDPQLHVVSACFGARSLRFHMTILLSCRPPLLQFSARDYLETALMPVAGSGPAVEAKNGIRSSIKSLFPDRDCATLVRPMHEEEVRATITAMPQR